MAQGNKSRGNKSRLGLVACCDVVLAAESTIFSLSETRLGLVPAVISPYVVRPRHGVRNARRVFILESESLKNLANQLLLLLDGFVMLFHF